MSWSRCELPQGRSFPHWIVSALKIRGQTSRQQRMLSNYVSDGELFVDNTAGALL
jgi:hypothetical protein